MDRQSLQRMEGLALFPIDSLFVDGKSQISTLSYQAHPQAKLLVAYWVLSFTEVQDYTQAELYILTKLCHNPNNMFLAGDTAQSIAVSTSVYVTITKSATGWLTLHFAL